LGSIALVNHLGATDTDTAVRTKGLLLAGTVAFGVGIAGFAIAPALSEPKKTTVPVGLILSPNESGILIRGSF
jgi:hypothetical protein